MGNTKYLAMLEVENAILRKERNEAMETVQHLQEDVERANLLTTKCLALNNQIFAQRDEARWWAGKFYRQHQERDLLDILAEDHECTCDSDTREHGYIHLCPHCQAVSDLDDFVHERIGAAQQMERRLAPYCAICHRKKNEVRPGKWQCPTCD